MLYLDRIVQEVRTGTRELDGVVGLSDLLASLALGGSATEIPCKTNKHKVAVSFVLRRWDDERAVCIPRADCIESLQAEYDSLMISPLVEEGSLLSDYIQDSDSYRYCFLDVAGSSFDECVRFRDEIIPRLGFKFS